MRLTHRDEEVEEEGRASSFHFHLHGPAALESVSASDDEGEIVCS